jgi:hypothetical protein
MNKEKCNKEWAGKNATRYRQAAIGLEMGKEWAEINTSRRGQ